jgi:hypothetical protein
MRLIAREELGQARRRVIRRIALLEGRPGVLLRGFELSLV